MKRFKHAINGIIHVFKNETNFKIHILATISVILAGIYFSIDKTEWLIIILAICLVMSFEIINSALEYLSDFVSEDYNDKIKIIKDASAGAVLISAIGAFVLACIIFIPKVISIL